MSEVDVNYGSFPTDVVEIGSQYWTEFDALMQEGEIEDSALNSIMVAKFTSLADDNDVPNDDIAHLMAVCWLHECGVLEAVEELIEIFEPVWVGQVDG